MVPGLWLADTSNSGVIVGEMSTNAGEHCFLLRDGTLTDMGTLTGPNGQFCTPARLNASVQVTGWSLLATGQQRAFLYFQGAMQELGTLGGNHSVGLAINDGGMVVGYSEFGSGDDRHAFFHIQERCHDRPGFARRRHRQRAGNQ